MVAEAYVSPFDPGSSDNLIGYLDFNPETPAYSETLGPDGRTLVVTPVELQPGTVLVGQRFLRQPDDTGVMETGGLGQDQCTVDNHIAMVATSRAAEIAGTVSNYSYEAGRRTPSRLFRTALGYLGMTRLTGAHVDPQELNYPKDRANRLSSRAPSPIAPDFPDGPFGGSA